ncbi:unnamed protein product [Paramecium sonneborni]|uniref:Uncharacterized protein n=1 Tax=Paramecium sonneborni TaxID=65129 RepID=A0A8S1MFE7_9CILI|nr:unnamed protein product [Paramecium sonneborni]
MKKISFRTFFLFYLSKQYKYHNISIVNQIHSYFCFFEGNSGKIDPLIIKIKQQAKGGQQEIYQNNNYENNISIVLNNKTINYQLRRTLIIYIQEIYQKLHHQRRISKDFQQWIMEKLKVLQVQIKIKLIQQSIQSIIIIDQQSGQTKIRFTLEINDQQILWNGCVILKLINLFQQIERDIQKSIKEQALLMNSSLLNNSIQIIYKQFNYRQQNNDLKTSNYQHWRKYLKILMEGLQQMSFYKKATYSVIRDYQNRKIDSCLTIQQSTRNDFQS